MTEWTNEQASFLRCRVWPECFASADSAMSCRARLQAQLLEQPSHKPAEAMSPTCGQLVSKADEVIHCQVLLCLTSLRQHIVRPWQEKLRAVTSFCRGDWYEYTTSETDNGVHQTVFAKSEEGMSELQTLISSHQLLITLEMIANVIRS